MQRNSKPEAPTRPLVLTRPLVFHPLVVLVLSLASAMGYAIWVTWRFGGRNLENQFLYVVPIVVPFVCFLFDRAEAIHRTRISRLIADCLVVGISIMRAFGHVPFVSGHTLFLTYAILSPVSQITLITASLVMVEVIYLKYFVWHDSITSSGGIILGAVVSLVAHYLERSIKKKGATIPNLTRQK